MQDFTQQIGNSSIRLIDKLEMWGDSIILSLPNIVLSFFIMIVGYFLLGWVKKLVLKFSEKFTSNVTVLNLISNFTAVVFSALVLFLILGIFDLGGTINKILATAGVLGLAIGLALQDPLVNLFSGVMMSIKDLYQIGDIVETNGYTGIIKNISLRSTTLNTLAGQDVTIPNKDVIQQPLTNFSVSGLRRVELDIAISYAEDLEAVELLTIEIIKNIEGVIQNKPIEVYYKEFGESSINFDLRFWHVYKIQSDFLDIRSQAIKALKKAYNENDITIPFPIRTLDFGIKGGATLSENLNRG